MTAAKTDCLAGSLLSPTERAAAIRAKRDAILGWFRNYPWSHVDVLVEVTGLGTRAIQSTLAKMQRDDLVRSADILIARGGTVRIWGLTHHGLHFAIPIDEPLENISVFEPSKVPVSTLEHDIAVQSVHARALRSGWTEWQTAGQAAAMLAKRGLKIPDGIALSPNGQRTAIEVERTLKSARRYEELLVSYLAGRKASLWQHVLYLSPTTEIIARVERAYRAVKKARYNGQVFEVTPAHLALFSFQSIDSFLTGGRVAA